MSSSLSVGSLVVYKGTSAAGRLFIGVVVQMGINGLWEVVFAYAGHRKPGSYWMDAAALESIGHLSSYGLDLI